MLGSPGRELLSLASNNPRGFGNPKSWPFPRLSWVLQANGQDGRKCSRQEGLGLHRGWKMRGFEAYPEILIGIPCHCVGGTTGKAVGAVAVYIWILLWLESASSLGKSLSMNMEASVPTSQPWEASKEWVECTEVVFSEQRCPGCRNNAVLEMAGWTVSQQVRMH